MIPARKRRWLDALFYLHTRYALRRTFHAVYLRGGEHLCALPADRPVIAYANHTGWWDLLILHRLIRLTPEREGYGMMEEKQLRHYPFLPAIGAFGVDLRTRHAAARSLRYALRLLHKPRALVWLFPQGELRHPDEPVAAAWKPGLHFLTRHCPNAVLLPAAFRYEFFNEEKPVMLLSLGAPISAATAESAQIEACQREVDGVRAAARARSVEGFTPFLPPRLSINRKWEGAWSAFTGRSGKIY